MEEQRGQADFSGTESFVCYGCVVQLVCTESGVALPPMVRHTTRDALYIVSLTTDERRGTDADGSTVRVVQ